MSSGVTRSHIESQWARTRAARCSRCKPWQTAMSRSLSRWARWLDSRLACGCRSQSGRTQEIGTFVPLHRKARGVGKAAVVIEQWQGALRARDALSRWHHACGFTPGILPFGPAFGCSKSLPAILSSRGLHRAACCAGAQTPGQPDAIGCAPSLARPLRAHCVRPNSLPVNLSPARLFDDLTILHGSAEKKR